MAEMIKPLASSIKPVPLGKMRVSLSAQRELRETRVNFLLSQFDLEQLGYPVVSMRDGHYYVIDGQHRIEALKRWLGDGWEKQHLDCRCYSQLTEKQEADMFDRLNNQLTVRTFDKFKVRVTAGRPVEVAVQKIVEKEGLKISHEKLPDCVGAVGTLVRVFNRTNGQTLGRALRLAHRSFGDPGLTSPVIDGFGYLCQRYNGAIKDDEAIERLASMRGGVGAVMTRAEVLRKQTKSQLSHCVAAAVVDTLNAKRGGKKLPSWWTEE